MHSTFIALTVNQARAQKKILSGMKRTAHSPEMPFYDQPRAISTVFLAEAHILSGIAWMCDRTGVLLRSSSIACIDIDDLGFIQLCFKTNDEDDTVSKSSVLTTKFGWDIE